MQNRKNEETFDLTNLTKEARDLFFRNYIKYLLSKYLTYLGILIYIYNHEKIHDTFYNHPEIFAFFSLFLIPYYPKYGSIIFVVLAYMTKYYSPMIFFLVILFFSWNTRVSFWSTLIFCVVLYGAEGGIFGHILAIVYGLACVLYMYECVVEKKEDEEEQEEQEN